jgi:ribulose-5-phosphate 4-epimerase/fuculose-1-phosphate aldolase
MVRVKGQPADAQMLVMVEWGVFFDEVTASDGLVVVTFDGHVVSALQSIYCA